MKISVLNILYDLFLCHWYSFHIHRYDRNIVQYVILQVTSKDVLINYLTLNQYTCRLILYCSRLISIFIHRFINYSIVHWRLFFLFASFVIWLDIIKMILMNFLYSIMIFFQLVVCRANLSFQATFYKFKVSHPYLL